MWPFVLQVVDEIHLQLQVKTRSNFPLQDHRPVHQDSCQDNLPRHDPLQCGVCDCVSWILWFDVHGAEGHRFPGAVQVIFYIPLAEFLFKLST